MSPNPHWIAERIALPAVRYALGRRSYVVSDVCETVTALIPYMSHGMLQNIARDIREAESLGGKSDTEQWQALLALCNDTLLGKT